GGYAMIPMINDKVIANGWLTLETLIDFIAVAESTPGPFAVNIATFVGNTTAGFWGAICATCGVVLPSFVIILLIAKSFDKFSSNTYVKSALSGLRPVVVGLIASAAFSIAVKAFIPNGFVKNIIQSVDLRSVLIFTIILIVNHFRKLHPIKLVALGAVSGVLLYGIL
ncbi:MAG: chromate transporter, partial [Oscillospiraceae bacterium]